MLVVPPGDTRRAVMVTDPGYLPAHQVYVLAVAGTTSAGRRTVVIAGSLDPAIARQRQATPGNARQRQAALLAAYAGAGALDNALFVRQLQEAGHAETDALEVTVVQPGLSAAKA
jgi:hypothetical protein